MKKPKIFFITVAITLIVLFILGNWATSAQATSTGIVDAI